VTRFESGGAHVKMNRLLRLYRLVYPPGQPIRAYATEIVIMPIEDRRGAWPYRYSVWIGDLLLSPTVTRFGARMLARRVRRVITNRRRVST
jgi:hypothetical protein